MCGIAGILLFNESSDLLKSIFSMIEAMKHRGPDDEGYLFFHPEGKRFSQYGGASTPDTVYASDVAYTPRVPFSGEEQVQANLALGHRRLSILDLSPAGHQPMCIDDGRYWIVHNGEIYNHVELRRELSKNGANFSSTSDTEVLLQAYAHWGQRCLTKLVGMFAFAILDLKKRNLFLARDPFGIKPLYYLSSENFFVFASEIKAILEFPVVNRQVNPRRLYEYLHFGLTDNGQETLLADIKHFPSGHWIEISLDRPSQYTPSRYYDIDLTQTLDISFEEAASIVREQFIHNIRLHLRSDVPIGTALSGGIDSSAIVMAARQLEPDQELNCFSYVTDDPVLNEENWVDIVGTAANAVIHKTRPTPDELVADLDQLIQIQDEPFGSTSIYAQYRVMRLARENGIKVMLDGQGGDEILAGYTPYLASRMASLLKQGRIAEAGHFWNRVRRLPGTTGKDLLYRTGDVFLPKSLKGLARQIVGKYHLPSWVDTSWFKTRGIDALFIKQSKGRNLLRTHLYQTLLEANLPFLLRYEDRNSMAYSVESRVPFLTPEFVQFFFTLPENYLISADGNTKSVFRQAMKGIVPDEVLARKDKIAFATPEQSWLLYLNPWIQTVLDSEAARDIPFLNIASMRESWQEVVQRGRTFSFTVWRWLNFIRWVDFWNVSI
jgi:asparagine synthase (glutamine-hydrolysing)